ncbi:carbamoyltransferase HypF [Streptomyces antioxidans]|uniref:carbamoyltransferase HypF n=1 Tax=Streptomyces antioxidans TaxID=1507734 RepID=UPI00099CE489|nr:carbamoyltransferase HypF [Streptomyces antioxidans]
MKQPSVSGSATAEPDTEHSQRPVRRLVAVGGVVQGVGFRPFVHAVATELGLSGQVANGPAGARIEIEGAPDTVALFCHRLTADAPPLADIASVAVSELPPTGGTGFAIAPSTAGPGRTLVPPDAATCDACLAELADPADRRHRHPFLTCTDCGPRFTIAATLPYDRATTTMAAFPMCPDCAAEYTDPSDRRFHAQPVACWACGPRLRLTGPARREGGAALAEARRMLAAGAIVAVKGIGGYHLVCDAAAPRTVGELRRRKARGDKPFAVMTPDADTAARLGHLGPAERRVLTGRSRPIVLLRRRSPTPLAPQVCPGSPDIGVLLPYTPLHQLLFGLPDDPPGPGILVVTSGNLSGEPLVTDDGEARRRLDGLADARLWHDRPIAVACDDSVVRVRADGSPLPVRRSRGFAPSRVRLPVAVRPVLAVGGDLKNTLCLAEGDGAWLSAHIGDMDSLPAQHAFERAESHLRALTRVEPVRIAADRHPGYRSARWARRDGRPLTLVQHHHAHIASAMAEHGLDEPVLGVAFDGTGHGDDGAVWGGEVLLADYAGYRRMAHLAYVPLPGGDAAVRRPYRMALAHLRAAGLAWSPDLPCAAVCPHDELRLLEAQLARGVACVPTSSVGRLFDAVSSLVGVCHRAGYEAQAAVELEAAAVTADGVRDGYPFALEDPAPLLAAIVADLRADTAVPLIAARFHRAVAGAVRTACRKAHRSTGVRTVLLTGGLFANALLDAMCTEGLAEDGFTVLGHTVVPPGDGGLALGQAVVAARIADT